MEVCEEDFPEHLRPIIRQIKQATESIDIRYRMDMEADILEEMEEIKQTLLEHKAQAREFEQELNTTKEELNTTKGELAQKDQELKQEQEKSALYEQDLKIIAQNLHSAGIPEATIVQYLGKESSVIQEWLGRHS